MTPICVMCGVDWGTGFLRHEWCVNDGYYNLMERERKREKMKRIHIYIKEKKWVRKSLKGEIA